MDPREAFVVQNPVGLEQNIIASVEEDEVTNQISKSPNPGVQEERGTLYVGVKNERNNPVDELDRVAGENLTEMEMQFQGLKKQYISGYCKDDLVREADSLRQIDREMEKNHATFQSYNARGYRSSGTKDVIASHDEVVKREIERFAGGPPLLPEQYNSRTEGTAFLERMRELDEKMKKAIETNDSGFRA